MLTVKVVILLCLIGGSHEKLMGDFKIVVREKQKCQDEGLREMYLDNYKLSIVKRNAPPIFNGILFLKVPLDNNIEVHVNGAIMRSGRWTDNFFNTDLGGLCNALKIYAHGFYENILKSLGYKKCPIPAGNHTIKNLVYKVDFKIPFATYGKFKIESILSKKRSGTKQRIGCMSLILETVPK